MWRHPDCCADTPPRSIQDAHRRVGRPDFLRARRTDMRIHAARQNIVPRFHFPFKYSNVKAIFEYLIVGIQ
jgi:hypothetical protein